jgi:hypothetical protein
MRTLDEAKGQPVIDHEESLRRRLMEALERSDISSRDIRAERIIWLSEHQVSYGAVVGRTETLALLEEARTCFVAQHDIAALMLALAFIEHTLAATLKSAGLGKLSNIPKGLESARNAGLFPADILVRTGKLQAFRNPFAHLRDDDDGATLANRYFSQKRHPKAVMEDDAKEAMQLMYAFFRCDIERPSRVPEGDEQ